MNWAQVEGNWKQVAGRVKEKWGRFTDDELNIIRGKRERLMGKLQEKYGIAKEEAEKQVREFEQTFKQGDRTTTRPTYNAPGAQPSAPKEKTTLFHEKEEKL